MVDEKFEITNTDTRDEFIHAVENQEEYIAQTFGKYEEGFDEDYGFYLKENRDSINLKQVSVRRAYVLAKLSKQYNSRLSLREMYYALGAIAEYIKEFPMESSKKLNDEMTKQLNTLEILADVDRIKFTISTSPKGYFFYPFDYTYGNPQRKIAFNEELAVDVLRTWDMQDCQSIIVIEKESAVQRLIAMGFTKLTNTALVTSSGEFNRSIYRFVERFNEEFPVVVLVDGDVYGAKMISAIVMGSQRSRHLDFNTKNVYLAGLFPSVGEQIKLLNDKESKRPMNNEWAQNMLMHLKKFGLVDDQDVATWERNRTYELESLSIVFTSTDNQPIGMGIYLTEFLRLKELPVKPLPPDGIKSDFESSLTDAINDELYPDIDRIFITDMTEKLQTDLEEIIDTWAGETRDAEVEKYQEEINNYTNEADEETIKKYLIKQYCEDMTIQKYDLDKLGKSLITEGETKVIFDTDLLAEITESIRDVIDSLIEEVSPKIEELLATATVSSQLELAELDEDIEVCDLYDKVLENLKAKKEDAEKIRNALKQRLGL